VSFYKNSAEGGLAEVELGKLAQEKSSSARGTEDDFIAPGNGNAERDSFVRYYKVAGLSDGFGTFNAKYDDPRWLNFTGKTGDSADEAHNFTCLL
jgi:hypothetical protein